MSLLFPSQGKLRRAASRSFELVRDLASSTALSIRHRGRNASQSSSVFSSRQHKINISYPRRDSDEESVCLSPQWGTTPRRAVSPRDTSFSFDGREELDASAAIQQHPQLNNQQQSGSEIWWKGWRRSSSNKVKASTATSYASITDEDPFARESWYPTYQRGLAFQDPDTALSTPQSRFSLSLSTLHEAEGPPDSRRFTIESTFRDVVDRFPFPPHLAPDPIPRCNTAPARAIRPKLETTGSSSSQSLSRLKSWLPSHRTSAPSPLVPVTTSVPEPASTSKKSMPIRIPGPIPRRRPARPTILGGAQRLPSLSHFQLSAFETPVVNRLTLSSTPRPSYYASFTAAPPARPAGTPSPGPDGERGSFHPKPLKLSAAARPRVPSRNTFGSPTFPLPPLPPMPPTPTTPLTPLTPTSGASADVVAIRQRKDSNRRIVVLGPAPPSPAVSSFAVVEQTPILPGPSPLNDNGEASKEFDNEDFVPFDPPPSPSVYSIHSLHKAGSTPSFINPALSRFSNRTSTEEEDGDDDEHTDNGTFSSGGNKDLTMTDSILATSIFSADAAGGSSPATIATSIFPAEQEQASSPFKPAVTNHEVWRTHTRFGTFPQQGANGLMETSWSYLDPKKRMRRSI